MLIPTVLEDSAKVLEGPDTLDRIEVESRVCILYCQGKRVREIVQLLEREGVTLKRWDIHAIVRRAAESRHFSYRPPQHLMLGLKIREKYDWLRGTTVVHATDYEAIASEAAEKLLEMIHKLSAKPAGEVHIGFAGGRVLELTARILAERIRTAEPKLLRPLCLHALVASFGDDPSANPNSFLGHFAPRTGLPMATRLIGLPAPGFVRVGAARKLRKIEGIQEAFDQVDKLDLVVTSAGGHWTAGCSYLHKLHKAASDLGALASAGCVGDVMWRPIGPEGPIELDSGFRAMTLLELSQLPGLINQGTRVMLVLARCGTCGKPKEDLLDAVLSLSRPHLTDLVLDSITGSALLRKSPRGAI